MYQSRQKVGNSCKGRTDLRIVHIVQKAQRRGAELFVAQLAQWQEQTGHNVLIIYLYAHDGVTLVNSQVSSSCLYGISRNFFERCFGVDPLVLWSLHRALSSFKPDIVQLSGGRCLKYGSALRKLRGQSNQTERYIYRNIGSPSHWTKGRLRRWAFRYSLRNLDGVIAVSNQSLEDLKFTFGLECPSVRISRGVDFQSLMTAMPTDRREVQTPLNAKVLIYIGSLEPEKRPDRAIEVLAGILNSGLDIYLWVLGEGRLLEDCKTLASKLGVIERVRFLGCRDNIGSFIKSADLHILTSDTEGLPGCVIETSILGRPCVATDVGGVSEIIEDGQSGCIVPPGSFNVLGADRITELLTNDDLREKFAQRAQEIASGYSIEAVGEKIDDFYRELIGA